MRRHLELTPPQPPDEILANLANRLRSRVAVAAAAGSLDATPPRAFVLITPLGLPHEAAILSALALRGVCPRDRLLLRGWPRIATMLYAKDMGDEALLRAWALECIWARLWPHGRAKVLWLQAGEAEIARHIKPALRTTLPRVRVRSRLPGTTRDSRLHPFHVPDAVDEPREAALLVSLARRERGTCR